MIVMQNQNNNEVKLYSDTIGLTYRPTCVIYKGKKFDAPVFLTTLQSWDLIAGWLGTGEYKKWLK